MDRLDPSYNQEEDPRNHQAAVEMVVSSLQPVGQGAHGLLHTRTSETGTANTIC
jgi:hypothetical protein